MIAVREFKDIDLLVVKIRGIVTFAELEQVFSEFAETGIFQKRKFQISDVRSAELDSSTRKLSDLLESLKTNPKYSRPTKIVYLADNPAATAIAYMMCDAFNEDFSTRVFISVNAALTSLGLISSRGIVTGFIEDDHS